MQVTFEGRSYAFPDDATDAEITEFLNGLSGAPARTADGRPPVNQAPVAPADEPNIRGRGTPLDQQVSPERQRGLATAQKIRALEAQRDALYRERGLSPAEKSRKMREINTQITALERSLPTDWADAGGLAGNVVGALGGGAVGTTGAGPGLGTAVGAAVGGTAGGFLGRMGGAMVAIESQKMNDAEKRAYLEEKLGIQNILIDAGGNLIFMGAGGVISSVARNTAVGRAVLRSLGTLVTPAAKGEAQGLKPVFGEAGALPGMARSSDAELAAARRGAVEDVSGVSGSNVAAPRGAIVGESGVLESRAKQIDPQAFRRNQEALGRELDEALTDFRDTAAGHQFGETPGHTLERALVGIEQRSKAYVGPVYDKLRATGAGDIIDISALRARAQAALDKAPPGTLTADMRKLYQDIVANPDRISPEAAHELQSSFAARARDLQRAGQPDERAQGLYSEYGNDMRKALYEGLDAAANKIDPQAAAFAAKPNPAQAELVAARRAQQEAGAIPEARAPTAGEQVDMFGTPPAQGELLPSAATAAPGQEAAAANAAREAQQRAAAGAVEGAEGRLAAGMGEQKSMFAAAPEVDPRLPEELRRAAKLYRDMNEKVYSTTGAKALRAADARGPEHVAATIYARGNTTSIKELNAIADFAGKLDDLPLESAAGIAMRERAERLGFDVSRPLKDQVVEAQRGIKAEFIAEHLSDAKALAALPDRMTKPAFRRTFEAMFPDAADRQIIERLSARAQIVGRISESTGSTQGTAAALGALTGGGMLLFGFGAPGAITGGVTLYLAPKVLAHMMTKPAYKANLSKLAAYSLRTAQGGGGATVPEFVNELVGQAKAEGFDITKPGKQ